jgi:hypothetical protein
MEQKVVAQVGRILLLLGPPLAAALAELAHPLWSSGTIYQAVAPVVDRWLFVHVVLLAGFALTALGLVSLLGGRTDPAARAARILLGVFVVSNTAFIAIEGLSTGLLAASARTLSAAEQAGVEQAVQVMWSQPVTLVFQWLASFGLIVGVLATAVAVYPRSQARLPLAGLALTSAIWALGETFVCLGVAGLVDPLAAASWATGSVTAAYAIGLVAASYLIYTSGRAYLPFALLVLGAVTWQHTPPTGPVGLALLVIGLAGREIVEARSAASEAPQPTVNLQPGF